MLSEISACLLEWYAQHARELPWRGVKNAYAVWVSEIMLQQTRVETVIPYYQRWMARFPSLEALALASEQDVLRVWEGLGYYSRARNLQRAARLVMAQYGGEIPRERKQLEKLPGVGKYTAGALASIAFGQDEAALDGNIRRVLARLFDMRLPARSAAGERALWELARQHLPPGRAGDYNQALMDLGATLCVPRAPACLVCPLKEVCQANALGSQEQLPVLEKRAVLPHKLVAAAVIQRGGRVLIARRPPVGLLGGLWEFPGGKLEEGEDFHGALLREIQEELGVPLIMGSPFGVYHHTFTHFRLTLHAFLCALQDSVEPQPLEADELAWVQPAELADYPMGKVDRQIARKLYES
jgi:A/G-specific adenine glycosylase